MPNVVGNRRLVFTGSYLDPDAASYIARAGISDATEISAVNTFVKTCKATPTIWAAMQGGFCYLVSPTSYGASLNNLISSSYLLSATAAPSYSTSGWLFDGVTQFLKTGFVPNSVLSLNTGVAAFYSRSSGQSNGFVMGSSNAAGTAQVSYALRTTSDQARFLAYDSTSALNAANTDASGTFVFSLTSSTTRSIRRNQVSLGSGGTATGSLPAVEFYIGARNLNGTASNFNNYQICTVIQGLVGLSSSDMDTLASAILTYNTNVISGGR